VDLGDEYSVTVDLSRERGFRPFIQTKETLALARVLREVGILDLMEEVYELALELDYAVRVSEDSELRAMSFYVFEPPEVTALTYTHDRRALRVSFKLGKEDKIVWQCPTTTPDERYNTPARCNALAKKILALIEEAGATGKFRELLEKLGELGKQVEELNSKLTGRKLKEIL